MTDNPVRLTRSVKDALTRVTSGGAPVYVWPGGGITYMVDVTQMPAGAFGYVPTPALVAPIEFTMKLSDYAALGGHMDYVRPLVRSAGRRRCPPIALAEPDSGTSGMTRLPQIALLSDGRRLHLQDGPIDLIVEARGARTQCARPMRRRRGVSPGLLDELCAELPELRTAAEPSGPRWRAWWRAACTPRSRLMPLMASSRRWRRLPAAWPRRFSARCWTLRRSIGPMSTMAATSRCISAEGEHFSVGLMDRPDRDGVMRTMQGRRR